MFLNREFLMKNKYAYRFSAFLLLSCMQCACIINNIKENISLAELASQGITVHTLFQESKTVQTIIELPNATVINEGGIITEAGYILTDTQTALSDQHCLKRNNRDINAENPLFFEGRLAVISSPGSENWYHWLLQILPRLIILVESSIDYDRIYINNLQYSWQLKSLNIILKFLNISPEKILVINGDCIIQASTLIVPSVPFIPQKNKTMPRWFKEKIRSIFLDVETTTGETYEKIYISRTHASVRRVTNELELIKELEKIGFKIIYLEHLSPYEQAYIFNKAKIIVGPHGSGLANLIFADAGCTLIEIDHGVNPPRSFYQRMAKIMNCNYCPFYVDQTTEEQLEDDIIVDVSKFLQFVDQIIMNSKRTGLEQW